MQKCREGSYNSHMAGLRERKKQQTRDAIVREALRLFRKHGFEATTVAEIADAAEIAPRTFFSYFDTKEAVVFHDLDDLVDRLAEHLAEREPGATTFDALRAWVEETVQTRDVTSRDELRRRELIRSTPALAAQDRANRGRLERLVADNVAGDLDVPADSLRPRMVAAAAVAALVALGEMNAEDIPDDPMSVVDEAVAFLQGGLEGLRRR